MDMMRRNIENPQFGSSVYQHGSSQGAMLTAGVSDGKAGYAMPFSLFPIQQMEEHEPKQEELNLRRWQIRCVAIATLSGLLLLVGGIIESVIVAWFGIAIVAACLIAICALGTVAWWRFG
jgi:hypothetical protein